MLVLFAAILMAGGCVPRTEYADFLNREGEVNVRIFPAHMIEKIIDATSCDEVKKVLGLPTSEFGSGIVRSQWVFDSGEMFEISSLSKPYDDKTPIGVIFPFWHIKEQTTISKTASSLIATVEFTGVKRQNMDYRVGVESLHPHNHFLFVDDGFAILLDAKRFLASDLDKIEANVRVHVRRTDCDNVYGFSSPKKIVISKTKDRISVRIGSQEGQ